MMMMMNSFGCIFNLLFYNEWSSQSCMNQSISDFYYCVIKHLTHGQLRPWHTSSQDGCSDTATVTCRRDGACVAGPVMTAVRLCAAKRRPSWQLSSQPRRDSSCVAAFTHTRTKLQKIIGKNNHALSKRLWDFHFICEYIMKIPNFILSKNGKYVRH